MSDETLAKLAVLSEMEDRSASRIVERLVLAAPLPGERLLAPTVEDLMTSEPLRPVPPVQDISATKKVVKRPGTPEQGKTTMTGHPFGPVPKK